MLWGQHTKVYKDHKNLVRDALGLQCDCIYHWWFLLEEYDPQIVYINGVDTTVADAISRLDYDEKINTHNVNSHVRNTSLVELFNSYKKKTTNSEVFETDGLYVPTCTNIFLNQLESARATYSTIVFMPREDCKINAQNKTYEN